MLVTPFGDIFQMLATESRGGEILTLMLESLIFETCHQNISFSIPVINNQAAKLTKAVYGCW